MTTFVSVTLAWVLFRADSFAAAERIYRGMLGQNGAVILKGEQESLGVLANLLQALGVRFESAMYLFGWQQWTWLLVLSIIAFGLPNVQQFMQRYQGGIMPDTLKLNPTFIQWRPAAAWAVCLGLLMSWALLGLNRVDEFLYFQF